MQSISATYPSSISAIGFNCNEATTAAATSHRGILPWTQSAQPRDSSNCSLDVSDSSSRFDAMEVDRSSPLPETRDSEDCTSRNKRKLRKHTLRVRFAPETIEPTTKRITKKRKLNGDSYSTFDSSVWYTKRELKDIQKSCFFAVRTQDFMSSMWPQQNKTQAALSGDPFLDRFSLQQRKKRKLVRWKMNETAKVIKQFEAATGTKAPPELLSRLLRLYSKPMEADAVEWALNQRFASQASDFNTPETTQRRRQQQVQMKLPVQKRQACFPRREGYLCPRSQNVPQLLQLRGQPMPSSQQPRATVLLREQLRGL